MAATTAIDWTDATPNPLTHRCTKVAPEQLVHWVIAGGESGGHHRPLDLDDARALRDQCLAGDVPFWFKLLCTKPSPAQVLSAALSNHQVRGDS